MNLLIAATVTLILGYLFYGRFVEKIFNPDDRKTPAVEVNDGVDCVPISTWRAFLIQLLNIAGTGPVFGALMGAVFGPIVFLWIVFGCILGGAVYDYFTGMISERHGGASIAELMRIYFGQGVGRIMRLVSVVLLILVGAVFVIGPAMLLQVLLGDVCSLECLIIIILVYYTLSTFLPIDVLIARLYPVFGVVLLTMAAGIYYNILVGNFVLPTFTFANAHSELTVWPFLFTTVACGAISGFHATQSPLIAKCIKSEKVGRQVFYGAMIGEGIIALAWAAAGLSFYDSPVALDLALAQFGPSGVVHDISIGMMGQWGGILAILGVVICPITSGDTAFRAARLILAEILHLPQDVLWKRLLVTLPILAVGGILTQVNFSMLWRYFAWTNQTLAALSLWMIVVYFFRHHQKQKSWVVAVPAIFMTAVVVTYIVKAKEGFALPLALANQLGIAVALAMALFYVYKVVKK